MVDVKTVDAHLRAAGCSFRVFGRLEIRELSKVLTPDEVVMQAAFGYYENGFAILAVTNHRLILIDQKPMFLTIEDIRFDMIAEVDFNHRLLDARIRVYTLNKTLIFTSWSHRRLRKLLDYLQQRVMQLRSGHSPIMQQQFGPVPVTQPQTRSADSIPILAQLAMQGSAAQTDGSMGSGRASVYTQFPLIHRRRRFAKFYNQ